MKTILMSNCKAPTLKETRWNFMTWMIKTKSYWLPYRVWDMIFITQGPRHHRMRESWVMKSHMVLCYFSSGQSQLKTYWYFDYTKYLRDILQKNISWQNHLSRYVAGGRSHWATVDQLGKNVFCQGVNFHSWNYVDIHEVPKYFCGVLVWWSWR